MIILLVNGLQKMYYWVSVQNFSNLFCILWECGALCCILCAITHHNFFSYFCDIALLS